MIDDSNHPRSSDTRPADIPGVFHKNEKLLVACWNRRPRRSSASTARDALFWPTAVPARCSDTPTQELLGARIELLLPESKRAAHGRQRDEYFERPRARPMGIGLDLSGRRKDGAEFPVEVSLSTVETEEGSSASRSSAISASAKTWKSS